MELGVAQGELEDGRRAVDRNGAGQHWRGGEGTAVTGARGGRGGEGTVVTGARGDDDILLGGRVGRGQRGERWILLGVDGQRSRIPQEIPDSEC